jgi:hypothetical protein
MHRVLCLLLLCASPGLVFGQSDDEAWIERYMAEHGIEVQDQPSAPGSGDRIQPGDLPRFVGHGVRLTLANGRTRAGVVEAVDAKNIQLRAYMTGGEAMLSLPRAQVVAVELE